MTWAGRVHSPIIAGASEPTPRLYYPISEYFKKKFGTKVYKVSVSIAQTCPNREGKNGMETCIFCDEWGSAAYHLERHKSLAEQFAVNCEKIRLRYKAVKFLIYFQSYTNTFVKADSLGQSMAEALEFNDVIGLVIGTRPDCLPLGILKTLRELAEKTYIQIELGAQSLDDAQLEYMKRGHDSASVFKAVEKLSRIPNIDIGMHLIFGWPNETRQDIISAARRINETPVSAVKLHNLHVLKGTTLHQYFLQNQFEPVSLEDYAAKVSLFIAHLRPDIALHRLAAVASRWDELIAPAWAKEKMRPMQYIQNYMSEQGMHQGLFYDKLKSESLVHSESFQAEILNPAATF